jgi:arsenite methyltransferase
MNANDKIKEMVRQKYSEIALQEKEQNASSCCGATNSCSTEVYNIMSESYEKLEGYTPDADLGLGCGLPTEHAKIRSGDVVIDLGSGAGNDCFVARHECGPEGKVIGIDFTPEMISKAQTNCEKRGYHNVEFRLGDIEKMPVSAGIADVVVSNCVLNLIPDKSTVFLEINRVLKPGGHFCISDIVLIGELPDKLKEAAEMYAGCVSGAIQRSDYLKLIQDAGFGQITIQKEKTIVIPEEILKNYVSAEEATAFKNSGTGIFSITVFAKKESCCKPGSGCC